MRSNRRETVLKVAVAALVGLFILDRALISPAIAGWKTQSERIADLRVKVNRGRQLMERERAIRDRWAEMHRTDLAEEGSAAENEVFKAVARWGRESRISFTSLTPQWRHHDEGYDTFECRASATGDQDSLGRLIYEIESDPLPAHLQECELAARDAQGRQLNLTLRVSFIRLAATDRSAR